MMNPGLNLNSYSYGFTAQPAVDGRPDTVRNWNILSFSFEENDFCHENAGLIFQRTYQSCFQQPENTEQHIWRVKIAWMWTWVDLTKIVPTKFVLWFCPRQFLICPQITCKAYCHWLPWSSEIHGHKPQVSSPMFILNFQRTMKVIQPVMHQDGPQFRAQHVNFQGMAKKQFSSCTICKLKSGPCFQNPVYAHWLLSMAYKNTLTQSAKIIVMRPICWVIGHYSSIRLAMARNN